MEDKEILKMILQSVLHMPYRWGGSDPIEIGFDCSGLCVHVLQSFGMMRMNDDMNAHSLYVLGKKDWKESREFGAFVFFGKETRVTHVGICLNDRIMIEAGGGGSTTKTKEDAIKQKAFVKISSINRRKDIVGVYLPNYSWVKK
jgi:cell wall-associated NlpC family hydrolase